MKQKIVFVKDNYAGGWMAYDKNFPHISAIGRTKKVAKMALLEDLETVHKIEKKTLNP